MKVSIEVLVKDDETMMEAMQRAVEMFRHVAETEASKMSFKELRTHIPEGKTYLIVGERLDPEEEKGVETRMVFQNEPFRTETLSYQQPGHYAENTVKNNKIIKRETRHVE